MDVYRENRFVQRKGAEDGQLSALVGTNYTFITTDNWLLNGSYERSQIDNLQGLVQSRDCLATEAVYNSHSKEKERSRIPGYIHMSARLELRTDKAADKKQTYLSANRLFYQANEDLSITLKGYLSESKNKSTNVSEARFAETGLAFAYRPVKYDKYNFIGKVNYLEDQNTQAQSTLSTDTKAIIFAIEGAMDLSRAFTLVEKVAYRKNIESVSDLPELSKDVSLIATRLNYRVSSWTVGAEFRVLEVKLAQDKRTGTVFEIDREISDNIVFGFGYNLVDFTDDLTTLGRGYKVKGGFIRLSAKY
jgi:hypothetical protein